MRSSKRLDAEAQKENGVGNIPTPFLMDHCSGLGVIIYRTFVVIA